jgi:hypothetical protein
MIGHEYMALTDSFSRGNPEYRKNTWAAVMVGELMNKYVIAIAFSLLIGGGFSAAGQEPTRMPKLYKAVRDGWLQFNIVAGRIGLDTVRVSNLQIPPGKGKNKETLNIRWAEEGSIVDYEWNSPQEQFTLKMSSGRRLEIRRIPQDNPSAPPVVFVQNSRGKMSLTVGTGAAARRFTAPTLWHLIIAHPDETRQHLLPSLDLLQPPGGNLRETAAALETELMRKAEMGLPSSRRQWQKWVAQLGDDRFARRQAADRALRSCDVAVLSYLQQLNFRRLDAEQQYRVRRIIDAFAVQISDFSAEQLAAWLAGDPAVWLSLAAQPQVSIRQLAVKQLEALLEEPTGIDPQADPATQKARIEQLRKQLEEN